MDAAVMLQLFLAVFSAATTIFVTWFGYTLKKRDERRERKEEERRKNERLSEKENMAIREGVQAILRDRIIQMYTYCESLGYAPIYTVENMSHMYKAYHALGGNGAVTSLYERFKTFSHSKEDNGCDPTEPQP